MDYRIDQSPDSTVRTSFIDPEDVPFRRRVLLFMSILIVALSLCVMEWWAGVGIECQTNAICECYPRGVRCWMEQHFK